MLISELRAELSLSQEEFAQRIGLSSKGNVSVIERENRCGLRVALAIEALSDGRIDAADLNEDVKASRSVHSSGYSRVVAQPSPGKISENSPSQAGVA